MKKTLITLIVGLGVLASFSTTTANEFLSTSSPDFIGVSGNSFSSGLQDNAYFYLLGSGNSMASFRYAYVTVDDLSGSTYFTSARLIECDSYSLNPDVPCAGFYEYDAMESGTGSNFYSVTQNGSGKRLIVFDFLRYCAHSGVCGGGTYPSTQTSPIVLNPNKFYALYFIQSTSKSTGTPAGSFSIYGITSTLTTSNGDNISCIRTPSSSIGCGDVRTPYFYLSSSTLTTANYGFYTPASASSGLSLSGADSFCQGVASSSYAFGIPYGLCYVSGFLFIPSADSVDTFQSNLSLIKTRVPYSYATELLSAWEGASSTSKDFVELSIPITGIAFGVSSGSSLSVISSASFYRWVSAGSWATLRDISTVGLYFGFSFYLWHRARRVFSGL